MSQSLTWESNDAPCMRHSRLAPVTGIGVLRICCEVMTGDRVVGGLLCSEQQHPNRDFAQEANELGCGAFWVKSGVLAEASKFPDRPAPRRCACMVFGWWKNGDARHPQQSASCWLLQHRYARDRESMCVRLCKMRKLYNLRMDSGFSQRV